MLVEYMATTIDEKDTSENILEVMEMLSIS